MRTSLLLGSLAVAGTIIALGQIDAGAMPGKDARGAGARADVTKPARGGVIGPDVITLSIPDVRRWSSSETETAYSIATTSCNQGDENLAWAGGSLGIHPVISQTMYRLLDGRFEQIGLSWVKHGFCALQFTGCGDCPGESGCLDYLAPGCSDPYSAARNGSQFLLGPRWEIDAHAGTFVWPFHEGEGTEGDFRRRLRVKNDDLALPGALYFLEGHYVHEEDATAGNQNNNASYQRITVSETYAVTRDGPTLAQRPAIRAWRDTDVEVTLVEAQVPDEGLFILGYKATDNGDGTYSYEYAVQNMNSHRSGGAFSVPLPGDVVVTDIGFHDVDYHSGDGPGGVDFDGTDWPATVAGGAITWQTDDFADNENANALRWGTLYNFRFTADAPPVDVTAAMRLFRPGDPCLVTMATVSPGPDPCPADTDDNGVVDSADLIILLAGWGPCCGCPGDVDGDGVIDVADLVELLAGWGPCP